MVLEPHLPMGSVFRRCTQKLLSLFKLVGLSQSGVLPCPCVRASSTHDYGLLSLGEAPESISREHGIMGIFSPGQWR